MKKLVLSLILVAAGSAVFAQEKVPPPPPPLPGAPGAPGPAGPGAPPARTYKSLPLGSNIPNPGMMLPACDGPQVSFEQAKTDKGLLVMFSCNTCPYVIKAQPKTREAMETAKKLGIGMVVLNSNERQRGSEDGPAPPKSRQAPETTLMLGICMVIPNSKLADSGSADSPVQMKAYADAQKYPVP